MADGEYELKLTVDAAGLAMLGEVPPLAGVIAAEAATRATYHDTAGHDLRDAGVSLRIRSSGGRSVQTVKAGGTAAAGLFAREEWETPVTGTVPVIHDEHPVRALLPAKTLAAVRPLFTVAVTRRAWVLVHGGSTIEIVADDGAVIAGDRRSEVGEVELELKAGPPDGLFPVARLLAEVVPLRLGVLTKAERGYRLLAALPPEGIGAEPVRLAADASVADAFGRIVASCLRQFRLNEERLRDPAAPGIATEALHQARVALRRLRAALWLFAPVTGGETATHLGGELRWLAQVLGEARDLDVLIARSEAGERRVLEPSRIAAHAEARAALDTVRARRAMIELVAWVAIGGWRQEPEAQADAGGFVARRLRDLRRRVKRRGRHLERLDDEARHRVRIAAKRLRYAADFAATLFAEGKAPRRQRAFRRALARLQDQLGELNDLATAPGLRAAHGLPPGDEAERAPERAALLAKAAKAHRRFVEAKRFWPRAQGVMDGG